MKRRRQKTAKRTADDLFAKYIKLRDRTCQDCGKAEDLQCAHLISRRYNLIRHDPDNAVALCRGCHFKWGLRPLEWENWCRERVNYDSLRRRALSQEKPDYPSVVVKLRELLEGLAA